MEQTKISEAAARNRLVVVEMNRGGLTYQQIAERTGLTPNSVRHYLQYQRALDRKAAQGS